MKEEAYSRQEHSDVPPEERSPIFVHSTPIGGSEISERAGEYFTSLNSERGKALLSRLQVPVDTAYLRNGQLHIYRTNIVQMFNAWEESPDILIGEEDMKELTSLLYAELKYLADWENNKGEPYQTQFACIDVKKYSLVGEGGKAFFMEYEGLNALKRLFAEETFKNCTFKTFDQESSLAKSIDRPDGFQPDERFTNFKYWQQGFCIALRRFGEEVLADASARDLLVKCMKEADFLASYAEAVRSGVRPVLKEYGYFARLWDKYYLPLRYWKKTPASRYLDKLSNRRSNPGKEKEFTRKFYSQKADKLNNRGTGLNGLTERTPEIVTKWEWHRHPEITISADAANQHGFSVDKCSKALTINIGAKVRVK